MSIALAQQEGFQIHLPLFEGPFDLLLFFIERDEIDIYDIPIYKITQDFLAYLQMIQYLNIEVASEFILVAGTLMRIKSKMLLPRPDLDEKGQEIDPREELVARLLEYKKYKSVLDELVAMEEVQAQRVERGGIAAELKIITQSENSMEELENLDPYHLMKVFKKIWENFENESRKPRHVIREYPYKIENVRNHIRLLAERKGKIDFVNIIMENPDRVWLVFCFLAILELTQEKIISISVGIDYNQFWIIRRKEETL